MPARKDDSEVRFGGFGGSPVHRTHRGRFGVRWPRYRATEPPNTSHRNWQAWTRHRATEALA